jgi:MoxR-like ATPase
VYDLQEKKFTFNRGPLFTSLLLADEINRAPAKTQSALLEAMQERQVTVDGIGYPLTPPFITIATQNPLEQEGTYPLPEAQLDRFMFKLLVSYPSPAEEARILQNYIQGHDHRRLDTYGLQPVLSAEQVVEIQRQIVRVIVEPTIVDYITAIVAKTRQWPTVEVGASPRASVNLLLGSRALAACRGRNFVVPDDVKQLAPWVLRHRLRLNPEAEIDGTSVESVIQDVLDAVAAPQPSEATPS